MCQNPVLPAGQASGLGTTHIAAAQYRESRGAQWGARFTSITQPNACMLNMAGAWLICLKLPYRPLGNTLTAQIFSDLRIFSRTGHFNFPRRRGTFPCFRVPPELVSQVKSGRELLPGIHETFLEPATGRGKARQQPQAVRSVMCVVRSCFSD